MKKTCILLAAFVAISIFSACDSNPQKDLILPEANNDYTYTVLDDTKKAGLTCSLEVRCDDAITHELLSDEKRINLPEDGAIISKCDIQFIEGESILDILLREMQARKIHIEFAKSPIYNSTYIKGIANLYEFDCGALSGWSYTVNGEMPLVDCSQYKVENGDSISLTYICDYASAQ